MNICKDLKEAEAYFNKYVGAIKETSRLIRSMYTWDELTNTEKEEWLKYGDYAPFRPDIREHQFKKHQDKIEKRKEALKREIRKWELKQRKEAQQEASHANG